MKYLKLSLWLSLCLGILIGLSPLTAQKRQAKGKARAVQNKPKVIRGQVFVLSEGKTPGVDFTIRRGQTEPPQITKTDKDGRFAIPVCLGDTLYISSPGYYDHIEVVKSFKYLTILFPGEESEEIFSLAEEQPIVFVSADATAVPRVKMMAIGVSMPSPPVGQDEYKAIKQNGFLSAKHNPLSTFSTDVDVASYALVRKYLSEYGKLPPADAVRTEELLNYFDYNYPQPKGKEPIAMQTELLPCPWAKEHRVARISLRAKEIPADKLPPSHLVFLIDVSGSMSWGNRLNLVKSSMRLLTNNLRPEDKVSIVVYAGSAGLVLPPTSGANKGLIRDALDKLEAGGSTAGGEGIKLAYKVAEEHFIKGGNNRIILCSDGDFNVGVSSEAELERLVAEKRKSGVYLSVLGYGMGNHKDNRLQSLSEKGNGNHAYIDNLQEANRVLVEQFGSTLYAVAKDVKLQVEFNPQRVAAYRLLGYESRLMADEDFKDDTKDAAELGSGHRVTALYEIIPTGAVSPYLPQIDPLKYQEEIKPSKSKEWMTVKLRYKPLNSEQSREQAVSLSQQKPQLSDDDSRFALAVAMFAEKLRKSDYSKDMTYEQILALAREGASVDKSGYRQEFVRLVELAQGIAQGAEDGDEIVLDPDEPAQPPQPIR